jgi:putative endonuclease
VSDPRRAAAFKLGLSAEGRAALLLNAKGYRELARRWKSPLGEVDLVMRRGRTIVFVEVKARARLEDAAFAVLPRQQKRIAGAAEAWLAAHPEHAGYDIRFDAVLIAPRRLPHHIEAAFEAED